MLIRDRGFSIECVAALLSYITSSPLTLPEHHGYSQQTSRTVP